MGETLWFSIFCMISRSERMVISHGRGFIIAMMLSCVIVGEIWLIGLWRCVWRMAFLQVLRLPRRLWLLATTEIYGLIGRKIWSLGIYHRLNWNRTWMIGIRLFKRQMNICRQSNHGRNSKMKAEEKSELKISNFCFG